MSEYKTQHPELWASNMREGIDYVVRGVYKFKDKDGNWMVRTDRFPIEKENLGANVIRLKR